MNGETTHFSADRKERDAFIHEVIGIGNVVKTFTVDRGHPKGAEIHSVTDTAVIIIRNKATNKLITELIARPEQLRRLYASDGDVPPGWLLKRAYKNNALNYNEK